MRAIKILWWAIPAAFIVAILAAVWGPGPEHKPQVWVREIVVTADSTNPEEIQHARQKIDEIHENLEKGANFEQLAISKSDALNADRGGDMGWIGEGILPKHFEDIAFKLRAGEHSEIVEDHVGDLTTFRILYVEQRRNF